MGHHAPRCCGEHRSTACPGGLQNDGFGAAKLELQAFENAKISSEAGFRCVGHVWLRYDHLVMLVGRISRHSKGLAVIHRALVCL